MIDDYYRILKLKQNATKEDIFTSFERLSKKYKHDKEDEKSKLVLENICKAFEILQDDRMRTLYDRYRHTFFSHEFVSLSN